MKNKKKTLMIQLIILTISVITIIGSISYAYFKEQVGSGAKTNVNVQSGTVDNLTFDKCSPISITMTQQNFGENAGNQEGNTCVKAILKANNTTNTATENYNVYLDIKENNFVYTTQEQKPEIILQVTDPNGNAVTSIPNLTYNTELQGFDITTKRGLIQLASSYEIKVNNKNENPKTQEWKLKVILINLDSDQSANSGKSFNAEIDIQKEEKAEPITMFVSGPEFSSRIYDYFRADAGHYKGDIRYIKRSNTIPDNFIATEENTVSTAESSKPIFIWYEDNGNYWTVYYYSESEKIYLNSNSSMMFAMPEPGEDALTNGLEIDLTNLDISKVTNMSNMFYFTYLTDLTPIANWDTSKVTDMSGMFSGCDITDLTPIANWDTSKVTDMSWMFDDCDITDLTPIANWDTSKVTDMSGMFSGCDITDLSPIANWDTSSVKNMHSMFSHCSNLSNIDALSKWDTSKVTDMSGMFSHCSNLSNIDALSKWDTSSVTRMDFMFYNCSNLSNIDALSKWDTSSVTRMDFMFYNCSNLSNIDALSKWDTSSVTSMGYMFSNCSKLTNIDGASNWDTSSVTNMSEMFYNCSNLSNIDGASEWDTSSVTNMQSMFTACSKLTNIDGASNWDTSSVTYMNGMFSKCSNLSNIDGASKWDTSSVTYMNGMFSNCSKLTNIDGASKWDTSSVTSMVSMFYYCSNLTNIDGASNWDTSSVTNMSEMFSNCSNLSNIDGASKWDTSSVTYMNLMFYNCSKASGTIQILGNPTNFGRMFNGTATTGSGVTVNYGSATTYIDRIIATKSNGSNVVKGVQVN